MNSLPPPLGSGVIQFWRLDLGIHAATWDSGEGSRLAGGRWSPRGLRTVYAALDPATTILELAAHKGFDELDTTPHVLTCATVTDPGSVRVVTPDEIPNPNWLVPGCPTLGQQAFGAALMASAAFVLLPSVVSRHSWNLIFDPDRVAMGYGDVTQRPFALDPRLTSAP